MGKISVEKAVSYESAGWRFSANGIDLFLTEEGGHAAPVRFHAEGQVFEPYFISPWQTENKRAFGGCLKQLRGDFFCMPFGGNAEPFEGERHPGHGETANANWNFDGLTEEEDSATAQFSMDTKVRPAHVVKKIRIKRDHHVLYLSHTVTGSHGAMPLGHHPIVKMPADGKKMYLSFSPFEFGMTRPGVFSDPAKQAYQKLADGERFTDLTKIPTAFRNAPFADGSVYPSEYGYTDLFAVFRRPSGLPAWSAAVYPDDGYLWFSMKNPADLPATAVWTSNSGRFFPPWNGRTYCIGIEDVCANFDLGLKASVESNGIQREGIPTAYAFAEDAPSEIRHIQGIAPVPPDFTRVEEVLFGKDEVIFVDRNGKQVKAAVDYSWVR